MTGGPSTATAPSGVENAWMVKPLGGLTLVELASLRCALLAEHCLDYPLLRAVDDELESRAERPGRAG